MASQNTSTFSDKRLIEIGRIVSVHGIRGVVKVRSFAESAERWSPGNQVHLAGRDGALQEKVIAAAQPYKNIVRLRFQGIDSRDAAEALVGLAVCIDRESLPPLEDGSTYWADLIGLTVLTVDGELLGRLTSIMETGSNDVYVVRDTARQPPAEVLIPALESVIRRIDLATGQMWVDLPEGLR